jgi:hypothetical protein
MPDEVWTPASAQAALRDAAFQLLALQERLEGINRGLLLPPEPELEAMLEEEIVPTVAVEVSGCIECIVNDYLPLIIHALEHASRVTACDLKRDWGTHQEGTGR